ncbi:hypothetical protein, partial [Pseudomonas aeruginosa]
FHPFLSELVCVLRGELARRLQFAALKSLFKRKRYSYDTLEMREPGDHSNWLRGRDGDEGITNEVTSIHGLKELSELEI